ncbi:hypothetical protein [Pseudomonas sp. TE3610]
MPASTPWAPVRCLLLGLLCLCADMAVAVEALITARVEDEKIVNTTPRSRYCSAWNLCNSHSTIDVPFELSKDIDLSSSDNRKKVYVHLPSRQSFSLTNRSTGQTANVQLGFRFVSQKVTYQTQPVLTTRVNGGCSAEGLTGGAGFSKFLWNSYYPDAQRGCYGAATGSEVQHSALSELMLSYMIDFPPASSLSPGRWEGFIDYPIGVAGGFDFGDTTMINSDNIRFRVEIEVQHDMRVDMPANGGEVEVVPPGGWKQYETSNQVPPRLFHDAPLSVWASSPFSVYVECEHRPCGISRAVGAQVVPLATALTLPGTFNHNGQPVNRLPLGVGRMNAKTIAVAGNVSNQPGHVHFDVRQQDIRQMLNNRGAKYQGGVTLIFDANP